MDRSSWIFCIGALVTTVALAALGFRLAALPREAIERSVTPVRAETLPDIELGGGFGKVPVTELVGYYLDNPPDASTAGQGFVSGRPAPRRFGGC
jgi:hypothetical protein